MPGVTTTEMRYGKTRFTTYRQGDTPAIGVEIKPGGTIVVGRYLPDGRWVHLYTAVPAEPESQAEYRARLLAYTTDDKEER